MSARRYSSPRRRSASPSPSPSPSPVPIPSSPIIRQDDNARVPAAGPSQGPCQVARILQKIGRVDIAMKHVDKFSGTPSSRPYKFICQLRFAFSSMGPKSDGEKIDLAISCLRDEAYEWVEPYIDRDPLPAWLSDFDIFTAMLINKFSRPIRSYNASGYLRSLRQTDSVVEFAYEFLQAAEGLGWNDPPLIDQFYCGLKDEIKDELFKTVSSPPTTFESFIQTAINIDESLLEQQQQQQRALEGSSSQARRATQSRPRRFFIQRGKLRRKNNLCPYCGLYRDDNNSPDHASNCFPA